MGPSRRKQPLSQDDFQELNEAWGQVDQLPEKYRGKFREFLLKKREEYLKEFDPPMENDLLSKAGGMTLDAMNYGAGLVTVPSMSLAALLAGRPELIHPDDFRDTLDPLDSKPAPPVGEYLKRAGVPEGAPLLPEAIRSHYEEPGMSRHWYEPEKGGMLDPTTRGALGMAGDIILSPGGAAATANAAKSLLGKTTAQKLAKMTAPEVVAALKEQAAREVGKSSTRKALGTAAKFAADPLSETLERGGTALYKSSIKGVDDGMRLPGQPTPSDVLMKNNVWGGSGDIARGAENIREKLGTEVSDTLAKLHQENPTLVGSRLDIRKPVNEMLFEKAKEPGMARPANSALNKLAEEFQAAYGGTKRTFTLPELDTIKKNYQKKARVAGAYSSQGTLPTRPTRVVDNALEGELLAEANRMTAQRARRQIEDIADSAQPGLGGKIYRQNADIASLMGAEKNLANSQKNSLGKTFRDMGVGTLAGGLGALPAFAVGGYKPAAALVLAGMLGNTNTAKTGLGLLAKKGGRPAANLLRANLLENHGEALRQPSPWTLLNDSMDLEEERKR